MHRPIDPAVRLYLDLMKRCLTRTAFHERIREVICRRGSVPRLLMRPVLAVLRLMGCTLCQGWPADAETMIGLKRLENILARVTGAIRRAVPGDLIETGVWRTVWVADSFEGLPKPDPDKYPADAAEEGKAAFYKFDQLAVSEEQVREMRFLKGWFRDTLPTIPATQTLTGSYPKLSPGGYCLIDDDGGIPASRNAVEDYRSREGIREPVQSVDRTGVFWQKAGRVSVTAARRSS